MKKSWRKITGITLIVLGIILEISSLKLTGMAISNQINISVKTILGLTLVIGGIFTFLIEEYSSMGGLERRLEKPLPGKGIRGAYIPLSEILEKGDVKTNRVDVTVEGKSIYRDGRPVQGLKLDGKYIEFKGIHFTNPRAAKIIEDDEALEIKNFLDPYIYLAEALSYTGMSEGELKYLFGAGDANEAVVVNVRYPIEKVYLKFEKGRPTHYAVEGDITPEDLIERRGTRVTRKKVKDL